MKRVTVIVVLLATALTAQTPRTKLDRERILNALPSTEFPSNVYYDDGVAFRRTGSDS